MKIEVGTLYQTQKGEKVRIYALDGEGDYCVHGAVLTDNGWDDSSWKIDGESIYFEQENIVSEWKEPITMVFDIETKNNWDTFDELFNSSLGPIVPADWPFNTEITPGRIEYIPDELISAMCNCGGKIDTHKPECPENKGETPRDYSYYHNEATKRSLGTYGIEKCECGSESVGGLHHSSFCPKFKAD